SLQTRELLLLPRPVEEDVVPMADLEVLEGGQLEALSLDGTPELDELVDRPDVETGGHAPSLRHRLRIGDARAARHVVDEVRDDRLGARLPGEPEVLRCEHLLVEAQPRFHRYLLVGRLPAHGAARVGGRPVWLPRSSFYLQWRNGVVCVTSK